jgi:hypothetical protein
MKRKHGAFLVTLFVTLLLPSGAIPSFAAMIISDGSDGEFHPLGSQTIHLEDEAPDGVFNFTTIHIPENVTITFEQNNLNTPVFFAATGSVLIEGTVNISGQHYSRTAGPGGGEGGLRSVNAAGIPGQGLSPGAGGPVTLDQGNGGGGGGMATSGQIASSRTGSQPAAGGSWINRPVLNPNTSGHGGSGGGGGGGRLFFGVNITGGSGGGAGGGLQISTPGNMTIRGRLIANGGHGAWAFANIFAHGGPGGGGSGGNIELYANSVELTDTSVLQTRGGAGGGLSTEPVSQDPYRFSSGANGGYGYLFIESDEFTLEAGATIDTIIIPPVNADFDNDADVDGADLLIWQRGYGLAGGATHEQGDANHDEAVDHNDLDIWQQQLGLTMIATQPALGISVPEPRSLAISTWWSLLLSIGFAFRRRSATTSPAAP